MSDPLKYVPKPLIEEHYHIRELIERQEVRTADRTRHREKEKALAERNEEIGKAPMAKMEAFYCQECGEDFVHAALKQVEEDMDHHGLLHAFYRAKCRKGHWVSRLITDKHRDPYWARSKAVARDKAIHSQDLLQPFEEGFQLLYGKVKNI